MPGIRKIGPINSVKLSRPISVEHLLTFAEQLQSNASDGRFFDLHPHVEEFEDAEINAKIFKMTFPLLSDRHQISEFSTGFKETFLSYVNNDEPFHIVYHLTDDHTCIDEIATDLDPEVFRMLMLLAPDMSRLLASQTQITDYWLSDVDRFLNELGEIREGVLEAMFPQANPVFLSLFSKKYPTDQALLDAVKTEAEDKTVFTFFRPQLNIAGLTKKQLRQERKKMHDELFKAFGPESRVLVELFQQNLQRCAGRSYREVEEKKSKTDGQPSGFDKRQAFAVKKACFEGKALNAAQREAFESPLSSFSKEYVRQEIVSQLTSSGVLEQDHQGLALFVGSGDGRNVKEIARAFEGLQCFALEPIWYYAQQAVEETQWPRRRQLVMTVQEVPEEYNGKFDRIFVFNYNVLSCHEEFFRTIFDLLKPGGRFLLGSALTDPQHIYSNRTVRQHLRNAFGANVAYPGWTHPGKTPDYTHKQAFY